MTLPEEIARRQDRLEQLRAASEVIKARAKERYQHELSQFQAKEQERVERAKKTGKKPGGRPPQPPREGPRDKDQCNFTDPESRVMKTPDGFGQRRFASRYLAKTFRQSKSVLYNRNLFGSTRSRRRARTDCWRWFDK